MSAEETALKCVSRSAIQSHPSFPCMACILRLFSKRAPGKEHEARLLSEGNRFNADRMAPGRSSSVSRDAKLLFVLTHKSHGVGQCADATLNYLAGKALHFFQLRAELQQQQIHAGIFKFSNPLCHLLRRTNQTGAQSTIGN